MSIVYIKVVDDNTHTFGVQNCSGNDLVFDLYLSHKLTSLNNWKYGGNLGNWRYYYPTADDQLENEQDFSNAIASHTPQQPMLLRTNFESGIGERLTRQAKASIRLTNQVDTGIKVNNSGRPLAKYFRIEAVEMIITSTTPYQNNIKFGTYLRNGPRAGFFMDHQFIDLGLLAPKYQTAFVATIISKVYAAIFGNEFGNHKLFSYINGKTFSRAIRRMGNFNNVTNLVVALTQSGKGKEMLACAVFNIFLGRDSLVFVRNMGGNQAIASFKVDINELADSVRDYVEEELDVDMSECDFITNIDVFDGKTLNNAINDGLHPRGFIYVERTNTQKLELPFKKLYNGNVCRDMFSLFTDEPDEQLQSLDATKGKLENALYNKEDCLGGVSIFNASHMNIGFTATPLPLFSSKPLSVVENYSFNLIPLAPPPNYKGVDQMLPQERRIVMVKTPRKKYLSKAQKQGKTSEELVHDSNTGIKIMIEHMTNIYNDPTYPYVSGLIACSALQQNENKSHFAQSLGAPNLPIVAFSQDQAASFEFFFDTTRFFVDVDAKRLQDELAQAFNGTSIQHKNKDIKFKSVEKTEYGFIVSLKKKDDKTVQIAYDIIRMLYNLTEENLKPFILCVSFALANRAMTYKPSNHDWPLTHMYVSEKSKPSQYAVDAKQVAGRICSVDNYDFKRFLFAPEEFFNILHTAYAVDAEFNEAFSHGQHTQSEMSENSGYLVRTFEEALERVDVDSETGKVSHHLGDSRKLIKKRSNDDLLESVRSKVGRYETVDEYSTFHQEMFEDDMIDMSYTQNAGSSTYQFDSNHITQVDIIYKILNDNINNGGMTVNEIVEHLMSNDFVQTYENGEQAPQPFDDRYFVTLNNSNLRGAIYSRISSRLTTAPYFRKVTNGSVSGAAQWTIWL